MKLLFKITVLLFLMIFSTNLSAKNFDNNQYAKDFIKSDLANSIKENVKSITDGLAKKHNTNKFIKDVKKDIKYKEFMSLLDSFEDTEEIKDFIDNLYLENKQKEEQRKSNNAFTIFFFVSASMPDESIEDFITSFEFLKANMKDSNIQAKILFSGYPMYYDNKQNGKVKLKNEDFLLQSKMIGKYGKIEIQVNGDWKYIVNKNYNYSGNNYAIEEKFTLNSIKKNTYQIQIPINIIDKNLKIKKDKDPTGIYKYIKRLHDKGVESKNVKIHVHPWAFDYFHLDKVPAYAISNCQSDFRFKHCEHKYLLKGNINMISFFEIVSNYDEKMKKYYFKLLKIGTDNENK